VVSLIKYNISYYVKSAKYLPPLICYAAFLAINYSSAPIGIWSNLHITAVAIFVLSSWIGVSFINCEDKTQQYITMLHVKNETIYHSSKIAAIIIFLIPFYLITIAMPIIGGWFARDILLSEVVVNIAVHFLVSLLGVSIGIFFNTDIFAAEPAMMMHLLVISVVVVPLNVIFEDNLLVVYAYYLVPPVNFLAERWHRLGEGLFYIDYRFLIFVGLSLGYALILITLYTAVIRRRNKR